MIVALPEKVSHGGTPLPAAGHTTVAYNAYAAYIARADNNQRQYTFHIA
jgi:hypothetical protein